MCRTHHHIARERFLFDGTHCPHCLKEFHTHTFQGTCTSTLFCEVPRDFTKQTFLNAQALDPIKIDLCWILQIEHYP